ncbi:MAG: rhodanese-like domain-containing protein [Candidatus Rokubacteria bacterium]|nr:rhodanese-like domain-containing protein [Candidatus Rokubacteria bacterium]
MRRTLIPLMAAAVVLVGAAPAAPPDAPVTYIHVDELKTLLDKNSTVALYDVRTLPEFEELHIKGAKSLPVREVADRAPKEIPTQGLVVFY